MDRNARGHQYVPRKQNQATVRFKPDHQGSKQAITLERKGAANRGGGLTQSV
jgi:hypothetical protein